MARAPVIPGFMVRPVEPNGAHAWAAYACLPEVKQHTRSTATSSVDILALIERTLGNTRDAPIVCALVPEGEAQLVGTVGFHSISAVNGTAEITYEPSPSYGGRGAWSAG
jgi:RimJ/RimL family protein N-acetyltransferase